MKLQKETSSDRRHGRWYNDSCGTAFAMELIGERWALLIVRELMLGPRRFSELREQLPGISAKVLTERLAALEEARVLSKRVLPSPARAQVYELTDWGYRAEPILQELGRWAAASCDHNMALPLSPVSIMLSLRTMLDPRKAANQTITCAFVIGEDQFVARLAKGAMPIARGAADDADVIFRAPAAGALAPVFYGGAKPAEVGVVIEGDKRLAKRFIGLFGLPDKADP